MEENLQNFLLQNREFEPHSEFECDGVSSFVHRQLMELTQNCLDKSRENNLSSNYFYELSENMETLLKEVSYKYIDFKNEIPQINLRLIFSAKKSRLLALLI